MIKWSVQLCRSVTVTQRAVMNAVMTFCGTQTLRIAGTLGGGRQLNSDRYCTRTRYFEYINMKYWQHRKVIMEFLTSLLWRSVENTLLEWYLQVFFVSFSCYWPSVVYKTDVDWLLLIRTIHTKWSSVWNCGCDYVTRSVLEATPSTMQYTILSNCR
jgi:hypothetical protein